jgi:endonuclease/exonuclease/phosphatase family metal-dependent hydrolase
MRFQCLILGSGLAVACSAVQPAAAQQHNPPEKLTVMTWNLEWFYDDLPGDNYSKLAREKSAPDRAAWDWHRDAVARSISKSRPTILAVQEVENRRVLWYLTRALARDHSLQYQELSNEGRDHFTEQDVGLLFRRPAEVLSTVQFMQTQRMIASKRYYDVAKHLLGVFEFPVGGDVERVMVMNVHLRSRAEGESLRIRQARLIHHWLREAIQRGENVIVLGDTNTEERGGVMRAESDVGILCGRETETTQDDLHDLHHRLPRGQRQTHLLADRQFDRILVSQSLLDDDPDRPDLVFESIGVFPELAVQGQPDIPEEHWDRFWELSPDQRDLSDHYPVQATFTVR